MKKEIFMIYAKKKDTDPVFDYKTTANSWEKCMEILENLALHNQVVQFLNIVEDAEVLERTFDLKEKQNNMKYHKKSGGVISL